MCREPRWIPSVLQHFVGWRLKFTGGRLREFLLSKIVTPLDLYDQGSLWTIPSERELQEPQQ